MVMFAAIAISISRRSKSERVGKVSVLECHDEAECLTIE